MTSSKATRPSTTTLSLSPPTMTAMNSPEEKSVRHRWQAEPSAVSMAALADAIARLNADGDYVASVLTGALLAQRPVSDDEDPTPQEAGYLVSSGATTPEDFQETSSRVARGSLPAVAASTLLTSLHQSMSAESAALFLHLDEASLNRAVENGELYAVDVAGHRRFPSWQFSLSSPGKLLPHLAEIIALLRERNWISVSGLMATPQTAMVAEGRQTPVEWFRSGGGIEALERIVEGQKWR